MELRWPDETMLASHVDALSRGWSPDTRRPQAAAENLEIAESDPVRYLAMQVDREAAGPPIQQPDGSLLARLPGYSKWMWDGEFCGSVGFRWQPGTADLPPHVPGHIGYSVVPWKQGRGYATRALAALLDEVRIEGLPHVDLVTEVDNEPSRRVIERNSGRLIDRDETYRRYRIVL